MICACLDGYEPLRHGALNVPVLLLTPGRVFVPFTGCGQWKEPPGLSWWGATAYCNMLSLEKKVSEQNICHPAFL